KHGELGEWMRWSAEIVITRLSSSPPPFLPPFLSFLTLSCTNISYLRLQKMDCVWSTLTRSPWRQSSTGIGKRLWIPWGSLHYPLAPAMPKSTYCALGWDQSLDMEGTERIGKRDKRFFCVTSAP